MLERLPSRGQTARSPAFLASPSPRFASPACFAPAGIAARGRGPLAAAGSLTPSGVRLKAPAAPGLFRVDREITVKGSGFRGGVSPPQARGWACRSRHKFPPPPFFLRLSPVGGSGWKPSRRRRQNPPLPQAFSCSGSSSEGEGSKTAAGVRLVGQQRGRNVKERKRKNPIFAAGKIMPCSSVVPAVPRRRQQIKGAGGGRRRRKKRRAAADKTAL